MNAARGTDGSPWYRGRYDKDFWDGYARSSESRYDAGFAGRVAYTADELRWQPPRGDEPVEHNGVVP